MNTIYDDDFSLYIMSLRQIKSEWKEQYRQALECWYKTWEPVHHRFQLPGPLTMDGFLKQDEGAFIFHKGKCVSLTLYRLVDFNVIDFRRDSYFKEWPPLALDRLLNIGQSLFLANNLTVDPEYRNFSPHLKFKQAHMNWMIRRFRQSNADLLINTSRRDRGVGEEGLKRGGEILAENVSFFEGKETVDLVFYSREKAHECQDSLPLVRFTEELWQMRQDWLFDLSSNQKAYPQAYQNTQSKAHKKIRVPRSA